MLKLYNFLLLLHLKRKIYYIIFTIFLIPYILVGVYLYRNIPYYKEADLKDIFGFFMSLIAFFSSLIFWYLFYITIYKNTSGSSIEILSFSSTMSRKKMFFIKLFNHLSMVFIHSLVTTIIFLVVKYSVFKFNSIEVFINFIGNLLTGILMGLMFFVLMFFVDTLTKKSRKKISLAIIAFTSSLGIFILSPIVEIIEINTFRNHEWIGKGIGDFADARFFNKDKTTVDISFTTSDKYLDKNIRKNRDISYYQNTTSKIKALSVLTKYLNMYNIMSYGQGVEPSLNKVVGSKFLKVYNYSKNFDSNLLDNVSSINYGSENNQIYLLDAIWYWEENRDPIKLKKFLSFVDLKAFYLDHYDKIATKLQNFSEFQNSEVEWKKITNFIEKELEDQVPPFQDYHSKITDNYINHPTNINWIYSYIYVKAQPNNKKIKFLNSNSNNSEDKENFSKLNNGQNYFLNNFVDPKKIFAIRVETSDYEYPWVSYLLVVVIILGLGYISLQRYNNKDVA